MMLKFHYRMWASKLASLMTSDARISYICMDTMNVKRKKCVFMRNLYTPQK